MGSRLLAAVAVAGLLAAAIARVVREDAPPPSHPYNWIVAVVCCLLGLRVIAHTRDNALGWVLLAMGVCAATAVGTGAWSTGPVLAWISTWSPWPSYSLLPVAILIFPTGRPPSARWLPVLVLALLGTLLPLVGIGWASWSAPGDFWADVLRGSATRGTPLVLVLAGFACFVLSVVGAVASLVLRMVRARGTDRRLLIWAAGCTALIIPAILLDTVGNVWGAWVVIAAAFPIAALIAILRYGLYDIELLIHRSLLYGLLTAILVAVYAVVVLGATTPLPEQAHLLGTIAVVVALAPLHRVLRDTLERWLYGDRADPYRALSRLGEQLANPLRPEDVFPAVARSIAEALKLPYVAIYLGTGERSQPLARYGGSAEDRPRYPVDMKHGGEPVGQLLVEARAPDEKLGRRERRLLADLARQAAPTARSARLAQDLHRANERFEREREEDLQRIIRDLHDGIGPSLAGIRMQVDAIRKLTGEAGPRVRRQFDRVLGDLASISTQVKELVTNVRPQELRLGLLEAVRRQAERFKGSLTVSVTTAGDLDGIPDPVELAAYRIICEALTNISRHANACFCRIHLDRKEYLQLNVVDDGSGIPGDAVPGVGLESMRRRCEDLGGMFRITTLSRGTEVVARLPVPSG